MAKRTEDAEVWQLWEAYWADPTDGRRNALVEYYSHLVRLNAQRLWATLPAEVDLEDLMSAGNFGLMEAIAAFDRTRGIKFQTYSALRIRGAMLDWLRETDWVPRLERSRNAKLKQASAKLAIELGREPTVEDLAAELGVDVVDVERMQTETPTWDSLNRTWFENEEGRTVSGMASVYDPRGEDPTLGLQKADLFRLATKGLNQNERLIIILYYFEEMTMKEIGATLDLSESRISQMHTELMASLRQRLGPRRTEFALEPALPR